MELVAGHDQEIKYFDWGSTERFPRPTILDASLREGVQGILSRYPTLEEKLRLVELLLEVGIDAFDIGFPIANPEQKLHTLQVARYLAQQQPGLRLVCLARTKTEDVAAVVEVSQAAGIRLEILIYIGTSSTRLLIEQASIHNLVDATTLAVDLAVRHGLTVNFACQDATRSEPGLLRLLYTAAIFGEPLPPRQPVVGPNAFAIVGGIQSQPIWQAAELERPDLVSTIYAGVDPRLVNRTLDLHVGPLSDSTNVRWKATQLGLPFSEEFAVQVLETARNRQRIVTDDEIVGIAGLSRQ